MTQQITTNFPHGRVLAPAPEAVNVLIACEESQRECIAFRARGFNAYSCDVQPCSGKHPEWHIQGDVTPYLSGQGEFTTQDGVSHNIGLGRWHLIIAHPPCTYLCKVGSPHLYVQPDRWITFQGRHFEVNSNRYDQLRAARLFFMICYHATAPFVAVENPLPMALAQLPPPSCFIQPSWYGAKYTKKTLYWLKNLPPLFPTIEHPNPKCFVTASRGKYRSRTFPQVAEAIAQQWGNYVLQQLSTY